MSEFKIDQSARIDKLNNSKAENDRKFISAKTEFERLLSYSEIEYDKLNPMLGKSFYESAFKLKDDLIKYADKSSMDDVFWLASKTIITKEEAYNLILDNQNHHHLVLDNNIKKLVEECGELTQIAIKVSLHGIDSYNPNTGEGNYELIQKEMTDVIASIRRVAKLLHVTLPDEMIDDRSSKLIKLFGA